MNHCHITGKSIKIIIILSQLSTKINITYTKLVKLANALIMNKI